MFSSQLSLSINLSLPAQPCVHFLSDIMSKSRPVSIFVEPSEDTQAKPTSSEEQEGEDEVAVVVRDDVASVGSGRGSRGSTRMGSTKSLGKNSMIGSCSYYEGLQDQEQAGKGCCSIM